MLKLFPAIKPFAINYLPVDPDHEIYVEQSGNLHGIPVLVIHGGPGSGSQENHRCYFDPNKYHIIMFDQRGSGLSKPHASLKNNTTQHLLSDMEKIREFLQIKQWLLFGGSWGTTLALLYAQAFPENVTGFILRGIFLARKKDMDWLYGGQGVNEIFPDQWQHFLTPLAKDQRQNHLILPAYYAILSGPDEIAQLHAAKCWAGFESHIATLEPNPELTKRANSTHIALSLARIECHYFMHNCFIQANQIINDIDKIKHLPGILVHGRYDMVCLLENAWALAKHWPNAELDVIRDAGHSGAEPGIIDALIKATKKMADFLA